MKRESYALSDEETISKKQKNIESRTRDNWGSWKDRKDMVQMLLEEDSKNDEEIPREPQN